MRESAILRSIRARMGKMRMLILRYQVGVFLTPDGAMVHIGEKGVSDLIGMVPHTVRPEDVGKTVAVFVALEAKTTTGRVRAEQGPFLRRVNALGGIAAVVRSAEDAEDVVTNKWDSELVKQWTPSE